MVDFVGQVVGNKAAKSLILFFAKAFALLLFLYGIARFAPATPPIALGMVVSALSLASSAVVKSLILFFAKAFALLLFLYGIARFAPATPPIALGMVVSALSLASSAVVAYHAVVRKTRKQFELRAEGRLAKLNEGRKICFIVSFLASFWFVFWLVLELPMWETRQWILVVAMVPIFYLILLLMRRFTKREFERPFQDSRAIIISSGVLGLLLCVGFAVLVPIFYLILLLMRRFTKREFERPFQDSRAIIISSGVLGLLLCVGFAVLVWIDPVPAFSSVQEAYLSSVNPYQDSPVAAFAEIGKFNALSEGIAFYGLSKVAEISFEGYLIWRVVLAASALFGFASLLGACALSADDIRRIFLPLESAKRENHDFRLLKGYVALACTLPILFTALFVVGNMTVEHIEQTKGYSLAEGFIKDQIGIAGYLIDGKYYDQLAVEALVEETTERSSALYEEAAQTLVPMINEAFDSRIESVDGYLDWYYSLPADYERLARFFTGTVEDGMRGQLEKRLNEGFDDSVLLDKINSFVDEANSITEGFRESLASCELKEIPAWLIEAEELAVPDMLVKAVAPSETIMGFGERFGVSAVSGIAGGVVAKKIVGKVVAKPVFQKIVTRLLNALATRTGVELVSSAGGTVIAPGVGTAAGLLGGLAIGTAVDFVFLKVDEVANRESYKEEIVAAIEEARSEILSVFQS